MKFSKLKRGISIFLFLVLTLSFSACTFNAPSSNEQSGSFSEESIISSKDSFSSVDSTSEIASEESELSSELTSEDFSEASSEESTSTEDFSEESQINSEDSSVESQTTTEDSSDMSEDVSQDTTSDDTTSDTSAMNPYEGTDIKPAEGKVIAFTFDDGPSYTSSTKKILDKLEELGMSATFFMVGERVSAGTAPTIKRMVDLGCDIGNHSFNHPNFNSMTVANVKKQINDTNALLEKHVGTKATLIRPPYGNITQAQMASLNTPIICWDIDSLDWDFRSKGLKAGKSSSQIAEEIYNHTMKKIHNGGIVLMHDIYDTTADAFCMLADELVAQGYTLVSVSELLGTEKLMCTTIKYGFSW